MDIGVTAVMLPELDFDEQIALCRELGLRYYQYRPRVVPKEHRGKPFSNWGNHKFDLTPQRFAEEGAALTARLREAGLEPWGSVPRLSVDSDEADIRLAIEAVAGAEAKCMRLGPPAYPREPFDYAELLDRAVVRFGEIVERMSGPLGVKLIIETHAGSLATSPALAWNIVRHFDPAHVGVIFDLPNFAREGEIHPALAVSVLRDYIDCLHVGGTRRVIAGNDEIGFKQLGKPMCRLTESDLHVPTWLRMVRDAGLSPPLIVENYMAEIPGERRLRQTVADLRAALATM